MTTDATITLPPALLAPARARTWLAEQAQDATPHVLQDALLVVSELVTNAVRHAGSDIIVSLQPVPNGLRVAVHDTGAALPRPAQPAAPDVPNGRGLLIVEAMAAHWGVVEDDAGPGKTVWAELEDH